MFYELYINVPQTTQKRSFVPVVINNTCLLQYEPRQNEDETLWS